MQDIKMMQLGQVVDFCIEYNNRHAEANEEETEVVSKKKSGKKYRLATGDEVKAYFG